MRLVTGRVLVFLVAMCATYLAVSSGPSVATSCASYLERAELELVSVTRDDIEDTFLAAAISGHTAYLTAQHDGSLGFDTRDEEGGAAFEIWAPEATQ
jgi:hypothetical protein